VIRLERRLDTPSWLSIAVVLFAFGMGLLLAAVVLLVTDHNPLSTYHSMLRAGFTNPGALSSTLVNATPILLTALCALVAIRMRIYNIGGEGQLYMGAMGAAGMGIALGGAPRPMVMVGMIAGGCLAGALWAAIPGFLRSRLSTNEILTTLMLNYVAGLFVYYLIFNSHSYWRDLTSGNAKFYPQGKTLDRADWWPALHFGHLVIPTGFIIGLVLAAVVWWTLRSTRAGFQLRVIAGSQSAARYAGIRTKRAVLSVMVVSGGLAGVAGASMVGDFTHMLDPNGLQQAQFGYAGIVAAALVGFNPLAAVIGAIFIGSLTNAGFQLQGATFPQGLVGVIEGIILLCVLGAQFLTTYRIRRAPRRDPAAPAAAASGPALADQTPVLDASPTFAGRDLEPVTEP